jgi:hypothetical protein
MSKLQKSKSSKKLLKDKPIISTAESRPESLLKLKDNDLNANDNQLYKKEEKTPILSENQNLIKHPEKSYLNSISEYLSNKGKKYDDYLKKTANSYNDKFNERINTNNLSQESKYSNILKFKEAKKNIKVKLKNIKLEERANLSTARAEEKAAKKLANLGDISKYSKLQTDIKKQKDIIEINYHDRFTKPLYFKIYPIFALILCALTLVIFFISLINIIYFIGKTLYNIIILIFNDDMINYHLISYSIIFKYLQTNEKNYDKDPFYTYVEEYIVYNNIFYWFIAFLTLFIPFSIYILLFIFYKFKGDNYKLTGGIKFQNIVLYIMGLVIIHMVIHTIIFNNMFGKYVFKDFKKIERYSNDVNGIVTTNFLYLDCNKEYYYELLENNNINDINNFINDTIDKDIDKAKKLIATYVLYRYFIDNIDIGNINDRILVKKYITNNIEDDFKCNFIGLINYKKKIIKKYYTELNFMEKFIATKQDSIDNIKIYLNDNINKLNRYIINSPQFTEAYFNILSYMIVIFIINLIFVSIISYLIINDSSPPEEQVFPDIIKQILRNIEAYISNFIFYIKNTIIRLIY